MKSSVVFLFLCSFYREGDRERMGEQGWGGGAGERERERILSRLHAQLGAPMPGSISQP